MSSQARAAGAKRHNEPDRRQRIIDVTLDAIAELGVAGCTHRRIAAMADVPLGAMTYYFSSLEQLIIEALTQFASQLTAHGEQILARAQTPDEARAAFIELLTKGLWVAPRSQAISLELMAYASRNASVRPYLYQWTDTSEQQLAKHFDRLTTKMLIGVIDAVIINKVAAHKPFSKKDIVDFVQRLRPNT